MLKCGSDILVLAILLVFSFKFDIIKNKKNKKLNKWNKKI